jgi:hypothetical protein
MNDGEKSVRLPDIENDSLEHEGTNYSTMGGF